MSSASLLHANNSGGWANSFATNDKADVVVHDLEKITFGLEHFYLT